MTSAQEKWKQIEGPKFQIGHVNVNFSLSWVSPVAVAGAAAGIVSTLACHPLEVLKDRLTVSPDIYPSLSIAISKIYKDGGVGAFYAGLSPTLVGMLPYSTCYYFMYEKLKKSYCQSKKKKSLNRPEMLVVGALAGFTASTISFPLEVARKRLMVGALQGKCPPNMVAALAEVSPGRFMKPGKTCCLLRNAYCDGSTKTSPVAKLVDTPLFKVQEDAVLAW
ncbi:hypothetical protein GOBAR_AA37437 [Gossypium barbadense]|uniref:Uncharacterized protein n=1 Tax=Gossypium barbadense TaxID=3634 RepID=A0A2P5VWR8_GOSBA|nr:hypothetical protein GOBAR_AA37437 [Gossypium barbadense]